MSKNSVPSSCDSGKIRSACLGRASPPGLAGANRRPPVFFVATGFKNVLNYSFQTGEEFTLEFMQDRPIPRRPLAPAISEHRMIGTGIEQPDMSEERARRKLLTSPSFNGTSSQGASKMKFLCSFGGRFLPRPGDGQLRYVGGERRLLRISRDMSWQELVRKTRKLCRRAHTVKYHLPGEQENVLISVASDDDLRHMIDECIVLEGGEERPAMYLFTGEDDEHHVHFVVGSPPNADTEAQFIALVNGFTGPGEASTARGFASASGNDLDQLAFDDDEEGSVVSRSREAPMNTTSRPTTLSDATTPSKTTGATLEKMHSTGTKDCVAWDDEGEASSFSDRWARTARLGSSVPSEFTYQTALKQQNGLQQTETCVNERIPCATRTQERRPSRRELLVPIGHETPKTVTEDCAKPAHRHTSSDGTVMNPARCSSEEASVMHHAATGHSMEVAAPSGLNASIDLIQWHDDTHISLNRHAQEQATDDAMPANAGQEQRPSRPDDDSGEIVPSPLRPASSGTAKQDAETSKAARSRSLGSDGNSAQVRDSPQEAKRSAAPTQTVLELEGAEAKNNTEPAVLTSASFGRDVISNVQIISNEDLEDLREMGAGAFGTVFHGRWKGTDVAIKRIKNSCFAYPSSRTDKLITEFWREAGIISKLHHPNVLAFYGVVEDGPGGTLATVTEFMVSGSLKRVLLRRDRFLDRRKRLMLAMDAAIGMEYLHSKQIVHFDLKCDNLLVNLKDPSRPICKVADFGLSKMKQTTMVSGGMRGTLPWMAPELLTMGNCKVSEKVDVYSFGIVMWEILTGEEPYAGMHYGGVIGGILSNTLRPPVPDSCEPEWRRLMEQCWSTDPEQRPSFTEVAARLRSMLEAGQGR